MAKKNNVPLIVGLSIPVLMIIFIAISIYLPRIFHSPQTDFLFVTGYDYYAKNSYIVEGGRLNKKKVEYPKDYNPRGNEELYIYDVIEEESKKISFEDAKNLSLDSSSKSPDGYEVVYGDNPEGLFSIVFDGWRNRGLLYLKGKGGSRPIKNPKSRRPYYYRDMQFIGWVIDEGEK